MPSTYSPNKNYELQATGENQGTWGVLLNNNALSIIDLNFGGRLAVTIDSANVDLTATQAQNVYITLTGTLTGNRDLTFPASDGGFYYILNNTSGAFSVTVKPLGGTGVVVPQGALSRVFINPTATTAVHLGTPSTATGGAAVPISSDGTALGTTALPFSDLFLASGGVVNWAAGDVTITHATNSLAFAGASSGYTFDTVIKPSVNDGAALGTGSESWSDAFLASGGVLNWGNGAYTVTHSPGLLAFSGQVSFGTALQVSSGGTGATTLSGLLQGNGTGAITGGATINNSNWSGTGLAVVNGGTGASDKATARTNLGVGTSDNPQFASIELGNATDTTLSRSAAGVLAVEGKKLLNASYAAFRGSKGSTQTFSSTAGTVTWTEDYDVGGYFSSNAWTPPAGIVSISVSLNIEVNNSSAIGVSLLKNGGAVVGGAFNNSTGGFNTPITLHYEDVANGSDAYTVRIDSGGSSTQVKAQSVFTGHLVGGT